MGHWHCPRREGAENDPGREDRAVHLHLHRPRARGVFGQSQKDCCFQTGGQEEPASEAGAQHAAGARQRGGSVLAFPRRGTQAGPAQAAQRGGGGGTARQNRLENSCSSEIPTSFNNHAQPGSAKV